MNKKKLLLKKVVIAMVVMVIGMSAAICIAQEPTPDFTGPAEIYNVTLRKIEISQDGNTWITLGEGDKTFSIADANVGETIGNYVSGAILPEGTYTKLRVTVYKYFTIKGYGTSGGTTYYTTSQTWTDPNTGDTFGLASTDINDYDMGNFAIPNISGDNKISTENINIEVKKGVSTKLRIKFDTQNMVGFEDVGGGTIIFYPMPPNNETETVN